MFIVYAGSTMAVGIGLLAAIRWIHRRSPTLAWLVGLGVLGRTVLAAALFWLSYLQLGLLGRLHTGDGFWDLAPDARSYFLRAAEAWEGGASIDPGSASPAYVRLLSVWMLITGPSVPGAVLLNIAAYVGTCLIVVAALNPRGDAARFRACCVSIAALTFSPGSVLFGSQTLKDTSFVFFVIASCGALLVLLARQPERPLWRWSSWLSIVTVGLAAYLLAGMRPYFPFLQVLVICLALVARALSLRRAALSPKCLAEGTALVLVTWMCFAAGAGPYYDTYERLVFGSRFSPKAMLWRAGGVATAATASIESAREGFLSSGGATNILAPKHVASIRAGGETSTGGTSPLDRMQEKASAIALGLAVMFVPISLLRATGVVEFAGGRGLLLVADADTVFLVGSAIAVAVTMRRLWWPVRRNEAFVVFTVTFALLLAVLMAYVVTNFGTLFRLRLMVAALIWATPLALAGPTAAAAAQRPMTPGTGEAPLVREGGG